MKKDIYIIAVESKDKYRISQEAYGDYESAKNFILSRADKPTKISPYVFESDCYKYIIGTLYMR